MTEPQVITARGEAELFARTGHLFSGLEHEFTCAATDMNTWSDPARRSEIARDMGVSLAGGTAVRKLYSGKALADEGQRTHLRELAAAGAQVRIAAGPLPYELLMFDRKVIILAGPPSPGGREFTATTSPTVITTVASLFDGTWQAAAPLEDFLARDRPWVDGDARTILRELASGRTDTAAARRLGVSLRTYRRRVAELMRLLESESRFQAGVRAGRLGLTP
ncbi:MAG: DNA-binding response regulator [Streptosporangiales bacterium]|nr:DNA-binding response regulator [Streptosporangiales bacterium]